MNNKGINLGESNFKSLVGEGYFYLDKSLFIEELWKEPTRVLLCPRPRRFGKTTNLSMIRYFFENLGAEENAPLFEGLDVSSKPEVMEHQGKYPVNYLTFKEAKQNSFEGVLNHS